MNGFLYFTPFSNKLEHLLNKFTRDQNEVEAIFLALTNTLAYFSGASVTKKKAFIDIDTRACTLKPFTMVNFASIL